MSGSSTETQFKRLRQIAVQQELRNFQYQRALSIGGVPIEENSESKVDAAAELTEREMAFAKTQLAVDLNAKSFDEVLNTNLSTSLGKLAAYQGSYSRFGGQNQSAWERYGEHYGTHATTELQVPTALTTAPNEKIEWNQVEIPKGWKLEDAMRNLEKKNQAARQIVEARRIWTQERDDLRDAMHEAQSNGDVALAKELTIEYAREFGGASRSVMGRQFSAAMKIAKEDVIEARHIVKALGGDPGPLEDL